MNRTIQNVENIKLEDLAVISETCAYRGLSTETMNRFIEAIKPRILESWESGELKEKTAAISIASKFTIAVSNGVKYIENEKELWTCILEMLKWSLKS